MAQGEYSRQPPVSSSSRTLRKIAMGRSIRQYAVIALLITFIIYLYYAS